MRRSFVIVGTIAMVSAAFAASPPAQKSNLRPIVSEPITIQSSALHEGIEIDDRKFEKPIRVILPSPFEVASRVNKQEN